MSRNVSRRARSADEAEARRWRQNPWAEARAQAEAEYARQSPEQREATRREAEALFGVDDDE